MQVAYALAAGMLPTVYPFFGVMPVLAAKFTQAAQAC
jgi:uncharacterized protein (DUF2062 family)